MATPVTHTIGTNGGLRDYTTFTAWEAAQQRDLVALDEIELAECYDDGILSDRFVIDGWTTSASQYIRIHVPSGQRHDGTAATGFRLRGTDGNAAIIINVSNVEIDGIVLLEIAQPKRDGIVIDIPAGAGWIWIQHCILAWGSTTREDKGIVLTACPAGVATYISNNAIYGWSFGIQITPSNRTVYAYNNSILNCTIGFYLPGGASTVTAKNTVALENPSGDFRDSADFAAASDYNASTLSGASPYKAPGTNSLEGLAGTDNFVSIVDQSEDLHVKDINAGIYDAGIDLSGDPNLIITDDFEYETRSATWSIGADESIFVTTQTKTVGVDTAILEVTGGILDLDIVLAEEKTLALNADAAIRDTHTLSTSLDAFVASTSKVNIDTAIKVLNVESSVSIDAVITGSTVEHSIGVDGGLRDYTLLSSWEAAQQRDLVALDQIAIATCYDDGIMDDGVVIDGWTTNESHYIKIHAPISERTYGADLTLSQTQGFHLRSTGRCISINVMNVWIDGLRTSSNATGTNGINIYVDVVAGGAGFIKISNCYSLRIDGSTGLSRAISIVNVTTLSKVYLWNNSGHSRDGVQQGVGIGVETISSMQLFIAHNSYAWKQTGILLTGDQPVVLEIVNNACLQCSVNCFNIDTIPTLAFNNASSDTTAPGTTPLHNLVPADNFKDLSAGKTYRDLRIKDAASPIYLAAQEYLVTPEYEDMFGSARDFVGASESVGASEHLNAFVGIDAFVANAVDIDHQVNIYNQLTLGDIDHLVSIQLAIPSLAFLIRKPAETLDYTARLMNVGRIVRKLQWDIGISQVVKANVEVENLDKKLNYFDSASDFYPNIPFVWAYAGLKSGWGKNLDQDSRYLFVGKIETLDLIEQQKANWILTDRLRDVLDDETSTEITFNSAYVAAQPNLDSLNPVHIVKHILRDLLALKTWDFDANLEVDAINETTFDSSHDVVADITVNSTTWGAGTKYSEMIQGALVLIGGWLYVNGDGKFDLKVFNPFDLSTTPVTFLGDETDTTNSVIFKSRLNATRREIINRIEWRYGQADTQYGPIDDAASIATYGIIKKDLTTKWEVTTTLLDAVTERLLSRFSSVPKFFIFETSNLTVGTGFNAELADIIEITDPAEGVSSKRFQVIEKEEDPLNRMSRMTTQDIEGLDAKFGMASSEIDEGDGLGITANDFNNWIKGFAYAATPDLTDPHYISGNPGFDLEGNANNVMESDIAPLDPRGKSIELIFVAY